MARLGAARYLTDQIYRVQLTVRESLTYRFVVQGSFASVYCQQIPRYLVYVLHFGRYLYSFYEMVRYSDTNWLLEYRDPHQKRAYQPDKIWVYHKNNEVQIVSGAVIVNQTGIFNGSTVYNGSTIYYVAKTYAMISGEAKMVPYVYTDLPTLIRDMIKMLTRPKRPYADSVCPIRQKLRILVQSSSDSLSASDSDSDHSPAAEDSSLPVM